MLQTNLALNNSYPNYPMQHYSCDRVYNADEIPAQLHKEDDEETKSLLGANIGNAKKFVTKPSFWKKVWNGIKNIFQKTAEKPKNITFDDLKDYGKTAFDFYDTYHKIQTSPNTNNNQTGYVLNNVA